ncbi:MAG: glycosyltransferase [Acidobacteriia bacterium]|nr:glycosyltransferase [Terriglobia bacterium]
MKYNANAILNESELMVVRRPTARLWKLLLTLTKPLQTAVVFIVAPQLWPGIRKLFSEYHNTYPELRKSGLIAAFDYVFFGAGESRDPHPLFDTAYYLEENPDVKAAGINPLRHYLRRGAAEMCDPHPLFSTRYYLEHYPDVQRAGMNPLLHYVRFGQFEGRKPHSAFDPEFYTTTYRNALTRQDGALVHYLRRGFREGYGPAPEFDPTYYLQAHPDIAAAGLEPFTHYIRFGKKEGRNIRAPRLESAAPRHYLPVEERRETHVSVRQRQIDIIIPVYRGLEKTRTCLESVSRSEHLADVNVVLVNDATPEEGLITYLRTFAAEHGSQLLEHGQNTGFVASANEGMGLHPNRDVILLNSDTEVFGNWVDRLADHAYSGRVASVTPFSNNATICSYPKFGENNEIPKDATAEDLDEAIHSANAGRHCVIPTAVGFCMYIRRDALNDVGPFDEATFGKGYGEENDFCMRAADRGWIHLLAADTFVYHAGSVSFGAAIEPQQRAMEALLQKHPRYLDHIGWHCHINPANAFRIAATVYRLCNRNRPVRLNVIHSLGGGTWEHALELERVTAYEISWLRLTPVNPGTVRLSCDRSGYEFSVEIDVKQEYELLVDLLRYMELDRIHVHHVTGFGIDIETLVAELQAPYDVTLHDYYFLCPRITFTDPKGKYCGEPIDCPHCAITALPDGSNIDLLSWRSAWGAFLTGASRIIAPSGDTAERFKRHFPWLEIVPAWHDNYTAPIAVREVGVNEKLRVAVLGVMALHKGYENLDACAALAAAAEAAIEFRLIGDYDPNLGAECRNVVKTGWYKPEELSSLISEFAPHLVWFPCQGPETFSYTLSACLRLGIPVAVPDLGALPERIDGRAWSWIMPWNTTPEEWLRFFVRIREQHFQSGIPPPSAMARRVAEKSYYPQKFLESVRTKAEILRAPKRSVIVIPSSFKNGQVQACGYIRLIQPLTHPSVATQMKIHVMDVRGALKISAEAVIVQRTAIIEEEKAEQLIRHCMRHGMRLIYDIDDDLFRLPSMHPEYGTYRATTKAAKLIARAAHAVTVSTEPLRQAILRYNDNVVVIPNYIDERLWPEQPYLNARWRPHSTTRALYMGTATHKPDLEILKDPVRRLAKEFDFQLDIIGVAADQSVDSWYRCIPVPENAGISYPRFSAWLRSAGTWDIGLAPLCDSRFNAYKSAIKVYEYAALGLVPVASAVSSYVGAVEDGRTGLLVSNIEEDWYESLRLLCESSSLRDRLRDEILSRRKKWALGENASELKRSWEQVLFHAADRVRMISLSSPAQFLHDSS